MPTGNRVQNQAWRPVRKRYLLPQPIAHGHHHFEAIGPGYLAAPGAGVDHLSRRRADAHIAAGSVIVSGQHAAPIANERGWIATGEPAPLYWALHSADI